MATLTKETVALARKSFDAYNVRRIFVASDIFSENGRLILAALPVLLHYNYDGRDVLECPRDAPCGILSYEPRDLQIDAFNKLFPYAQVFDKKPEPFIHSIALVGSLGTAAQTDKSDFDLVLFVYERILKKKQLDDLQIKLTAIEKWSMNTLNVETHFFISDIPGFRENRFGETDKETVGSAMGKLFKDEFYRTAIFLAGKRPLWWVTPLGLPEKKTEAFYKTFKSVMGNKAYDYIDLGHLQGLEPQEFFGATLWQMNKSISYPFKSLLKMALLESYLLDEGSLLLCEELKKRVLELHDKEEQIDPYLMMYERINSFYAKRGMKAETRLLRGAFLMKIGMDMKAIKKLIAKKETAPTEKQKAIARLIEKWKLDPNRMATLHQGLPSDDKPAFQPLGKVNRFFLDVYKRLTDWLNDAGHGGVSITAEDLTVLGRKLFTYFEQKKNKIQFVYPGSKPETVKREILLIREDSGEEDWTWSLYDFHPITHESGLTSKIPKPVHNCHALLEMIAWIAINSFWKPGTRLRFRGGKTTYEERDVKHIFKNFFAFFLEDSKFEPSRDDYLSARRYVKAFVTLNLGYVHTPRKIERVDMVMLDSWGEYSRMHRTPKKSCSEIAEMMLAAETAGKPFNLLVVTPLSQIDPGLGDEFEYAVEKIKKHKKLPPLYRKKAKLDLE